MYGSDLSNILVKPSYSSIEKPSFQFEIQYFNGKTKSFKLKNQDFSKIKLKNLFFYPKILVFWSSTRASGILINNVNLTVDDESIN